MFKEISRPLKRKVQQDLNQHLFDTKPIGAKANYCIGLSGPNPIDALNGFDPRLNKRVYFAESNLDTYNFAIKKEDPSKFKIFPVDIFYLIANVDRAKISGVDFDFCKILESNTSVSIIEALKSIVKDNKKPFWIRIASSYRGTNYDEIIDQITGIKERLKASTKVFFTNEVECSYNEQGAMYIYQAWICLDNKKEKKEMKIEKKTTLSHEKKNLTTECTLKQLSSTERLMVQTLSKNTGPELSLEDIRTHFGLSKMSIAALKAWDTMRSIKK